MMKAPVPPLVDYILRRVLWEQSIRRRNLNVEEIMRVLKQYVIVSNEAYLPITSLGTKMKRKIKSIKQLRVFILVSQVKEQ